VLILILQLIIIVQYRCLRALSAVLSCQTCLSEINYSISYNGDENIPALILDIPLYDITIIESEPEDARTLLPLWHAREEHSSSSSVRRKTPDQVSREEDSCTEPCVCARVRVESWTRRSSSSSLRNSATPTALSWTRFNTLYTGTRLSRR